jgi:hypothetical protein
MRQRLSPLDLLIDAGHFGSLKFGASLQFGGCSLEFRRPTSTENSEEPV